ncbi:MAG: carboxypeptidase regulatory-like domain-containing protein, partial [Bacteroidota bacterium]
MRIFKAIVFYLFPAFLFSQEVNWTVAIKSIVEIRTWQLTTKAEEEIAPLSGAQIKATSNGSIVATATSGSDGKFTINLPANGNYVVEVSFPGLISKKFSVNSKGVPDDLQKDQTFKPSFGIGGFILSKPFKGINYSGLSNPLVHVIYDGSVKNFDDDESFTERGLEVAGKIFDDEQNLVNNFCSLNKQGDQAMKKPDCPLAKTLYEKANTLIPGELYPAEQLKKVGDCLKEIEQAEKKSKEAAAAKQRADSLAKVAEKEKQIQQQKEKEQKLAKEKREKEISDSIKVVREKELENNGEEYTRLKQEEALKKQKSDSLAKAAEKQKEIAREKDKKV